MTLARFSSLFARDLDRLKLFSGQSSLWEKEIEKTLAGFNSSDTDVCLETMQWTRRLIKIFTAGLQNDTSFRQTFGQSTLPLWSEFEEPPVHRTLQDRLAEMLYIVRGRDEVPVLELGDQARYVGRVLFERCVKESLTFDVNIHDDNFNALLLNAADIGGIEKLAARFLEDRSTITARVLVQHNLPRWESVESNPDKHHAYRKLIQPWRDRALSGKVRSVLTMIPTRKDADIDGIPYQEYAELYFRMCDQPWEHIGEAQKHLIEQLNAGKTLRFTNADGTDLSMDIDGFTFCNSVVARNIPGSEVFSAPRIDSVEGTIVAKGRFTVKEDAGTVIENLTMRFEKGELVEARAEIGQDHFHRALSVDAGARRIGEIGIGTNPYLKRHLASILLSEKIGGSFHVALGDAYSMKEYIGTPVNVDNGNRSMLHWDITTMLYGKQGRMYLDGKMIMDNGVFLDPALTVLNEGWKALPFDRRPPAWQMIYPKED